MFPAYLDYAFFKFIKKCLGNNAIGTVIDCPCGLGSYSYKISELNVKKVVGIDISENEINHAKSHYVKSKLSFECNDIHSYLRNSLSFDAFLIINSFFLLPRTDEILKLIYSKINKGGKLIVIVPNIYAANFITFDRANPEAHYLRMNKEETLKYFQSYGFKAELSEELTYVSRFYIQNLKLWKFKGAYIYLLEILRKLFRTKPCYWGFSFSKIE